MTRFYLAYKILFLEHSGETAGQWELVDMANFSQLGTSERIQRKKDLIASHGMCYQGLIELA